MGTQEKKKGSDLDLEPMSGSRCILTVGLCTRQPQLGMLDELTFSSARIQMKITAERPVIAGVLDRERFVTSPKQMPGSLISFGVPVCVTAQPVLPR